MGRGNNVAPTSSRPLRAFALSGFFDRITRRRSIAAGRTPIGSLSPGTEQTCPRNERRSSRPRHPRVPRGLHHAGRPTRAPRDDARRGRPGLRRPHPPHPTDSHLLRTRLRRLVRRAGPRRRREVPPLLLPLAAGTDAQGVGHALGDRPRRRGRPLRPVQTGRRRAPRPRGGVLGRVVYPQPHRPPRRRQVLPLLHGEHRRRRRAPAAQLHPPQQPADRRGRRRLARRPVAPVRQAADRRQPRPGRARRADGLQPRRLPTPRRVVPADLQSRRQKGQAPRRRARRPPGRHQRLPHRPVHQAPQADLHQGGREVPRRGPVRLVRRRPLPRDREGQRRPLHRRRLLARPLRLRRRPGLVPRRAPAGDVPQAAEVERRPRPPAAGPGAAAALLRTGPPRRPVLRRRRPRRPRWLVQRADPARGPIARPRHAAVRGCPGPPAAVAARRDDDDRRRHLLPLGAGQRVQLLRHRNLPRPRFRRGVQVPADQERPLPRGLLLPA